MAKKKNKKTQSNNSIVYNGRVTVSIKSDNKIISKKVYSNNGTNEMFKFLCMCLAGSYSDAEPNRPCRIKLFGRDDTPEEAIQAEGKASTGNQLSQITGFIGVDKKATVNVEADDEGINKYSTTYHFVIPAMFINERVDIKEFAIYSSVKSQEGDWSAYYLLTKIGDNNSLEWDPIKISTIKDNVNIIIDWEMSITNPTK